MCQNYHWSLDEATHLTLPQIFMMNHAAWVNSKRMDERIERDKTGPKRRATATQVQDDNDPIIPEVGKRLSECTSEEIASQFTRW